MTVNLYFTSGNSRVLNDVEQIKEEGTIISFIYREVDDNLYTLATDDKHLLFFTVDVAQVH